MLAILGLLGLAVAGTAFIGLPMDGDGHADADLPDAIPEDDTQQTADMGDLIQPDDAVAETSTIQSAENSVFGPVDDIADGLVAQTSDEYDQFFGGDGNDIAESQGGGDYLDGRGGDDTLFGGDGDDHIHGGSGNDMVSGDDGDDLVYGYTGDDDMFGGHGSDALHGGAGDDVIDAGSGNDVVSGGHGNDSLAGGAGRDNLQGGEGDDIIDGVSGEIIAEKDYLNGSEGRDTLIGNNGDVMSGGEGADRFEVVNGTVTIMDYAEDDLLVVNYVGTPPELTIEATSDGTLLFADGEPVASLYGVTSFDVASVQLVAA